jgi:diguanylate cyclase (GGDEF)-like protein
MPLAHTLMLNSYSLIILAVILLSSNRLIDRRFLQNRLFILLLLIVMFLLPVDVFARLDGVRSPLFPVLNQVGNFLLYLINPIVPSIWMLYVYNQIHQDDQETRRLVPLLWISSGANAVALILSQYYGWYYIIDNQNIYHRGPLFFIPVSITVIMLAVSFAITLIGHRKLDKRSFLSLLLFPMPLVFCIGLQLINYQLSTLVNGLAISLLIVFINIQSRSIHTDHLTGIHNRKMLEDYLKRKITSSTPQHSFAAILLDLDDFKAINDAYGHDIGDKALTDAVQLLKRCVRINDFVARYGGDEFIIVLDITSREDLQSMVDRINHCTIEFNKCPQQPYLIQFSMGYAVYDADSGMTGEEFVRHIDTIMYESKQNKKLGKDLQIRDAKPVPAMTSFRLVHRHAKKSK